MGTAAVSERAKTIVRQLRSLASLDKAANISVVVSSNGMWDFVNAWQHLQLFKDITDRVTLFWVSAIQDQFDFSLFGGFVGNYILQSQMLPSAPDPVVGVRETFIPADFPGMDSLNPEARMHFNGSIIIEKHDGTFETQHFLYKRENVEMYFRYNGLHWTTSYPFNFYKHIYHDQLAWFAKSNQKLSVPVYALVALDDGFWKPTNKKVDNLLNKYFNSTRKWMGKHIGHLFVINSLIVREFFTWCQNGGQDAYSQREICGKIL